MYYDVPFIIVGHYLYEEGWHRIDDIGQSQLHNPCEREKKVTCDIVIDQCH